LYIFVAPHPDDVALSCGGAVAKAARDGDPLVVTVFAGQPTGDESAFARMQHEWWGFDAASVIAERRAEDVCAAAALGTRVRPIWLEFLDAIYRHPAYDSNDALFGSLLPEDEATVANVTEALADIGGERVFVPLGVGNHVDHQIVFRAGQRLAERGIEVWAYADVPYALARGTVDTIVSELIAKGAVSEARLTYIDDDAWERRATAIDCYASQLTVIFRDHGDHRIAVDRYLREVGGGRRAEVCWQVLPGQES